MRQTDRSWQLRQNVPQFPSNSIKYTAGSKSAIAESEKVVNKVLELALPPDQQVYNGKHFPVYSKILQL